MKFTYEKVKNDIWEVIKDKADFVYESANDCDACTALHDWQEWGEDVFDDEPPPCTAHYDQDACRYFYADEKYGVSDYNAPACVVGHWFVYEGFTEQDLGVDSWESLEGNGVTTLLEKANIEIDSDAINFLNNIQTNQDTGLSWGYAFARSAGDEELLSKGL